MKNQKLRDKILDHKALNHAALLMLFVFLPAPAYAASMAGHLTFYYMLFFIPVVLLIHFIAIIYFQKRDRYRSKAFTIKHLTIVMLFFIIGIVLTTFEYMTNMSSTGLHIGTFLSILFVYGFISLLFAIPYLIYLMTKQKDDSTLS